MGSCFSVSSSSPRDTTVIDPIPSGAPVDRPPVRTDTPSNGQRMERDALARPHAPPDHPRASLLTNAQFSPTAAAHSQSPGPLSNSPPEIVLEVANHLPARDKAALARTSHAYRQTLPKANHDHGELKTVLAQLTAHQGRNDTAAVDDALRLLGKKNLHPEDHRELSSALTEKLLAKLSRLSDGGADSNTIKKTVEQSLSLLDTAPTQSLNLATNLSSLLRVLRSPGMADAGLATSNRLRKEIASVQPVQITPTKKDALAWLLCNLNRDGLHHVPESERGLAFEQHLSAMERLYATNYVPQSRMANPLSSAIRQVASLPAEQQSQASARLNALQRWGGN